MRIIILIILRVQAITKIQVITKIQDITRPQAIARIQTDIIKVLEAVRILNLIRIMDSIRILDMHNTAIQIMQTTPRQQMSIIRNRRSITGFWMDIVPQRLHGLRSF